MNRLPLLLVLALSGGSTFAAPGDQGFEILAQRYLDELPRLSPVNATQSGNHSADDQLDDVSEAGRAASRQSYQQLHADIATISRDELSRANQVDLGILSNKIDAELWAIDTFQEWAWNPLLYIRLAGNSVYSLVARDFAPLDQRLLNVAARLQQFPRFLAQARQSTQPERVPKIHAETAIKQNAGLNSIIDTMILPKMSGLPATTQAKLNAAIDVARKAIAEHQAWLEDHLLPRAAGNFRIGAELFDRKLAFALQSPLDRREIKTRAENEYEAVRNAMYEIAREVYAKTHPFTTFPDTPDDAYKQVVIRAALEQAYQRLPPRDGIVALATQQLQQATDFVVEKQLVTMPAEPVEIIVMPEFQRGVSVAYLDPPGPLDVGQKAFYAVAPLPTDWSEAQIASFLREYNVYSIHDLTIHEGVPGHYLQLALSNRYPSTLRSLLWSGPFVEGWAVYAERMMIDSGYLDHDPLMRLINLKWYLRAVTNAIIDAAIHVDQMSREAAMNLMVEGGFQEQQEAAGKWVRAQLTAAQLSTYFVGYQEHIAMRQAVEQAWGEEFTLRRYHDQVLAYGSPPVKYVRALILNEALPQQGQ